MHIAKAISNDTKCKRGLIIREQGILNSDLRSNRDTHGNPRLAKIYGPETPAGPISKAQTSRAQVESRRAATALAEGNCGKHQR
nr:hypothetical protein Iba_chr12cCG21300 [Ipomoea batatas]